MFNWESGTVAGVLTVASGGVLNITGNVSLQNVLTNAGTVTMSGAANLAVYQQQPHLQGRDLQSGGGAVGHPDQREHPM